MSDFFFTGLFFLEADFIVDKVTFLVFLRLSECD